jgi:hypothetical protein
MAGAGPFALVQRVAKILDGLAIPYALGGSLASSLFGEPRTTVDVDIAISVDAGSGEELIESLANLFYIPAAAAREAIAQHTSFNALDIDQGLKVDLFVLGDGLLDRMQIERRVRVLVPDNEDEICVTSMEVQVLRKLEWYRQGGGISDRQWRDVVGILRVNMDSLDLDDLRSAAESLDLSTELEEALVAAGATDS